MNDKEYEDLKSTLGELIKKWQAPLGLLWWNIKFIFDRSPADTNREGGYFCQAETSTRWEYLSATITLNMTELLGKTEAKLEEIVVHEMCHVLVAEMRQWADDMMPEGKKNEGIKHEERVVTCLTNAFLWTREAGEDTFNSLHPKPIVEDVKNS